MISRQAKDLYFLISSIPRWVLILSKYTGDKIEDIEQFADYIEGIERQYKNNRPLIEQEMFDWVKSIVQEDPSLIPKPKSFDGEVTQDMIECARNFPITDLIANRRMWAVCPFHSDRNPSLFLKNNFYHCFVCGANGDTIKLTQHIYNVDFKTAVKMLQ